MKLAFVLLTLFLVHADARKPAQEPPIEEPKLACPTSKLGKDSETWRAQAASLIIDQKYDVVKKSLDECFVDDAPACLDDLNYYLNNKIQPFDYVNAAKAYNDSLGLRSPKDMPEEFWVKDAAGNVDETLLKIPDNILELAKQKGWKATTYKTRGQGGFDAAPNLLIVVIPAPKRDITFQIGLAANLINDQTTAKDPVVNPANGSFSKGQATLTLITTEKDTKPPTGQLRQLFKNSSQPDYYNWRNEGGAGSCFSCHTMPLRPISPVGYHWVNEGETKMTPEHTKETEEINKFMEVPSTFGKVIYLDKEYRFGPAIESYPLGWAPKGSATRQEEFIKGCASRATSMSSNARGYYYTTVTRNPEATYDWKNIARAMNCVTCHNNKMRGVLHEGFDIGEVNFKINIDRSMPLGQKLTTDERLILYQCLKEERALLRDQWLKSGEWMLKGKCEDRGPSSQKKKTAKKAAKKK